MFINPPLKNGSYKCASLHLISLLSGWDEEVMSAADGLPEFHALVVLFGIQKMDGVSVLPSALLM